MRIIKTEQDYKRELVSERHLLRLPNSNVTIAAEIEGKISENELVTAVEKTSKKHPLMISRIFIDDSQKAWFVPTEKPISIKIKQITEKNQWTLHAVSEGKTLIFKEKGPLIQFLLLKNQNSNFLLVTCDHTICDGLALLVIIKDILSFLQNPELDLLPQKVPPPMHKMLPPVYQENFLFKYLIKQNNKKWKKKNVHFSQDDYETLHNVFWKRNSRCLISWDLSKKDTQGLIDKAKQEGVTVNSALSTAFIAAQNKIQGSLPPFLNNIIIPVDTRKYLTVSVEESLAYYAGALRLQLKYSDRQPFWQNVKIIDQKIHSALNKKQFLESRKISLLDPSLIDSFGFSKYGLFHDSQSANLISKMGIDRINTGLAISNLGKTRFSSKNGDLRLLRLYGPIVFSDTIQKYVGIINHENSLTFTLSADKSLEKILSALRFETTQYLVAAT